jgi:hypothetical protein
MVIGRRTCIDAAEASRAATAMSAMRDFDLFMPFLLVSEQELPAEEPGLAGLFR